jgi:hypothetical protein
MLKYVFVGMLAALIGLSSPAAAQTKKGPNGGMVVNSQGHPIEFVLKGQELTFYLIDDDGTPLSTKGLRGRAVVQDGGKTTTIALQPGAPNMLAGKAEGPIGAKARVVFSANVPGHALTARYVTE